MEKHTIRRASIYAAGVVVMTLGVSLSIQSGLGVTVSTAIPYAISNVFGVPLSVVVVFVYSSMVAAQLIIRGKNRRWRDLLQLPFNFVFSSLLEIDNRLISMQVEQLWQQLTMVCFSVVLVGVGVGLMVNMKIIPNPPDGLLQAISETYHKKMGPVKIVLDVSCVCMACLIGLLFRGKIIGIGIGTVMSATLVGIVISVFNHLFHDKLIHLAGLDGSLS